MTSINIKTKFKTVDELKKSYSDYIGRSRFFYHFQKRLWIEYDHNNEVSITSDGRRLCRYEFIGTYQMIEDHVFLTGIIKKREDMKRRQRWYAILLLLTAAVLLLSQNIYFVCLGLLFIVVVVVNGFLFNDETPFIKWLLLELE